MRATKVSFFLILLLATTGLMAQTNFKPGYYVTASGDTVRGYIEYRSEGRNYQVCVFKKDLTDKATKLYPAALIGYVVDEKQFYERQSYGNKNNQVQFVFFKVLMSGKLSLLRYGSHYFVKDLRGEIFEITKRSEVQGTKVKNDFYGLGVLKSLMSDCQLISNNFLNDQYKTQPDFKYIFRKCNECQGTPFVEPGRIVTKPHVEFGVQLSLVYSQLKIGSSLDNAKFPDKFILRGGVFASVFIPKIDERIRLVIEASVAKYSHYTYFYFHDASNNDFRLKYTGLSVPLIIRYNPNKFFLDIGLQSMFILNRDVTWRVETIVDDHTIVTNNGKIPAFSDLALGYLIGAGIKSNIAGHPLRTSIRYSRAGAKGDSITEVFKAFELNISYQLTK